MAKEEPRRNGGIWKLLLAISLSANITGLTTWLLFAKESVTCKELEKELSRQTGQLQAYVDGKILSVQASINYPWDDDRDVVFHRLGTIEAQQREILKKIEAKQ